MMNTPHWTATLVSLCFACSASPKINVGNEGDGSVAGNGGASGFGGVGGFGGGDNALVAHIEEPPGTMAIDVVTISCAGECAEVIAVATGGNDPYTFQWNDGVTSAARTLCADATTAFTVTVRDTPIDDPEFHYDAQTVTAEVTAIVDLCPPDGGVPDGGDGGVPGDALCIENPSFEGTPSALPGAPFDALPWDPCPNGVNAGHVVNATNSTSTWTFPQPTDGNTSGAIGTNSGFGGSAYLAQTLCEPIPAGEARSFLIDVARNPMSGSGVEAMDAQIQIYGGSGTRCSEAELLWTSPLLTPEWQTVCVTLTPDAPVTSLAFKPLGDGNPLFLGLMGAVIDHIVPVTSCLNL